MNEMPKSPSRCKHGCKRENPNSYDGFGDGNVVWGCNMLGINGFVPPSYVPDLVGAPPCASCHNFEYESPEDRAARFEKLEATVKKATFLPLQLLKRTEKERISYVLDAAAKAVNENRLDVALSMLTLLKETL